LLAPEDIIGSRRGHRSRGRGGRGRGPRVTWMDQPDLSAACAVARSALKHALESSDDESARGAEVPAGAAAAAETAPQAAAGAAATTGPSLWEQPPGAAAAAETAPGAASAAADTGPVAAADTDPDPKKRRISGKGGYHPVGLAMKARKAMKEKTAPPMKAVGELAMKASRAKATPKLFPKAMKAIAMAPKAMKAVAMKAMKAKAMKAKKAKQASTFTTKNRTPDLLVYQLRITCLADVPIAAHMHCRSFHFLDNTIYSITI
jgi:hypothetical protein